MEAAIHLVGPSPQVILKSQKKDVSGLKDNTIWMSWKGKLCRHCNMLGTKNIPPIFCSECDMQHTELFLQFPIHINLIFY